MLSITFNGTKPSQRNYEHSIVGNSNVDVIKFVLQSSICSEYSLEDLEGFNAFIKVQSAGKEYIDKISAESSYDSDKGTLTIEFQLQAKTTQFRNIALQLQFEESNGIVVAQSEIVALTLKGNINADEEIPDKYPSVLTQIETELGDHEVRIEALEESGGGTSIGSVVVDFDKDDLYVGIKDKQGQTIAGNNTTIPLSDKVDKESGKGLSSNDFTDEDKAKLDADYSKSEIDTLLSGKQDTLTFDDVPTENSNNPVKSGGVYSANEIIRAVAEGKCKSFTISIDDNADFNSQSASISGITSITDISGNVIQVSTLKNGDVILVIETDVPDRWYSTSDSKFYQLETAKVDLTSYVDLSSAQSISGEKTITSQLHFKNTAADVDYTIKADTYGAFVVGGLMRFIKANKSIHPINDADTQLGLASYRWKDIYLSGKLKDGTYEIAVREIAKKSLIGDEYSNNSTYAVGDLVIYNNTLYKCNTAITQAEEWDSTHWTATKLTSELGGGNFGFPILNAPSSTTLTQEEYGIVSNGCVINGTFLGMKNPVFMPVGEVSWGEVRGIVFTTDQLVGKMYIYSINATSRVIQKYTGENAKAIDLEDIRRINGKNIPNYPSSTGTFVLKCVDGTLTWVAE